MAIYNSVVQVRTSSTDGCFQHLASWIVGVVFALTLGVQVAYGQTSFPLLKERGHYYFSADVNGTPCEKIMVETGISSLTVSERDFSKYFVDSLLSISNLKVKTFRLDNKDYSIRRIFSGKVAMGGLEFNGNILVLDSSYTCPAIPLQCLTNIQDTTANVIKLDFKKKRMEFTNAQNEKLNKKNKFNIKEYRPFPVVNAKLELTDAYGHNVAIVDDFIIDIGCGSPMFIYESNPSVKRFLKESHLKIVSIKDKDGKTKGRAIYIPYGKFGNIVVRDTVLGIAARVRFGENFGCVGPSLFDGRTIYIDPVNMCLYY